jgi:predicted metal-dependent HD superfamily phosphohydrolase
MWKGIPWTRIQDAELAEMARDEIHKNHHLAYHNWKHVDSMYQYLADTNEPYDECLDWAVLFHDIVYDNQPKKEYRSAVMFSDMTEKYSGCDLNLLDEGHVAALIMATENHSVTYQGNSAIIRADLHGLANRLTTFQNFGNIMKESMSLYDIDEIEFAKNSELFMTGLLDRVSRNVSADPSHKTFYLEVAEGIFMTIKLAQLIQGKRNDS